MKKLVLTAGAVGLALVLAGSAMAADLTATGFIGVQGQVFKNVGRYAFLAPVNASNRFNEMGATLEMRVRLGFTMRASEDLYGHVMLEMDSNSFGETAAGPAQNNIGRFGADRVAVEVKNAYIDFRIPPKIPIWARVGVQGYYIRPQIFSYFDAAGVSLRAMIDPIKLSVTGYYAKGLDADWWSALNGSEFYALDMNIPVAIGTTAGITPGGFFAYQTYRQGAGAVGDWTSPPSTLYYLNASDPVVDNANWWWLGFYLNGKIGAFPMELDIIYQDGTLNATDPTLDVAYGSWLIRGWASWTWKNLEVGAGGMYVQGDDASTIDRYEGFVLPQTSSESPGLRGDGVVFLPGWMNTNPLAHSKGYMDSAMKTWPGFWYVRGFAYYKLFPWLKVGGQLMYLGDTVKHGDWVWGVGYEPAWYDVDMDTDDDHGIGWEMDFGVNVQLYKNLSFNGAFGYLFAQKALSFVGGRAPSDPWAFTGVLLYTF